LKGALRWLRRLVLVAVLVWATIVVGAAFTARARLPQLKPWHRLVPKGEFRAADLTETTSLADYLRREDALFADVRREVGARLSPADRVLTNRYFEGSPLDPDRAPTNRNRTFEIVPETVRGGVLLVHGLTDSPYSVRALAELYGREGFYALALRMPGHGTVPGALTAAAWKDWLAALARLVSRLGVFPYFEKAKWTDVLPEYNPYKYNSFPAKAGEQTWELTSLLEDRLKGLAGAGRTGEIPKVLAFQSLVDATVSAPAVVDRLFSRLTREGNELVLFDVNRTANLEPFLSPGCDALLSRVLADRGRKYTLTVVANAGPETRDVVEKSYGPGAAEPRVRPLGLSWPEGVFSLSHIALPFPPDDPLFGIRPAAGWPDVIHLGTLAPRGEKSALVVPENVLMRLCSNPFFPYLEARVREVTPSPPR
jgi:hypothetical protein